MQLNAIKIMERLARLNPASISLAQGIPSKPVDDFLHRAAVQAIKSKQVDSYSDPQGLLEFREALSQHLLIRGMAYGADEIVVTAGAIEALSSALRCLIGPDRRQIIVPTPVYGAYFKLIEVAGGEVVSIPLIEEDGWRLDPEAVIQAIASKTAAILLCSPNNPTGSVYPRETLEKITRAAIRHDVVVITDEVYSNMVYDHQPFYSPAMTPEFTSHVLRIMSFSKDFSLTGWRVGYAHGPHHLIQKMVAVHDTLVNCAPVISQYVAMEALDHYDRITAENRRLYQASRDVVSELLADCSRVTMHVPDGGYCVFPRIDGVCDSQQFAYDLAGKGLVVVPGVAFGEGGEGHIRICFGRPYQDVKRGVELLANQLAQLVVQ